MAQAVIRLAALLATVLAFGAAAAELGDPMAPPTAKLAPATAGGPDAALAPTGLQAIVGRGSGRRAMINGSLWRVGERFGDARITRIGSSDVTLRLADGRQETLRLYPAVDIGTRLGNNRGQVAPESARTAGRRDGR